MAIVQSDVTRNLRKVKAGKGPAEKDYGIIGNLSQLLETLEDDEMAPVSEVVGKQMMELAGRLRQDYINRVEMTSIRGVTLHSSYRSSSSFMV
ncbi:hypothetical protein BGZ75_005713 [Mortierella antarctica]|nr:hypothetical protein BGZ75_005713 [Mortierella antarctica]